VSRDYQRFPVPALSAIATKVGDDPSAAVYISERRAKIIISPVDCIEKGFHTEQEPNAVLSYDCSTEMIGQAVWESLLLFRHTPNVNLRSRNKTDWPAYRASGVRSVRAFEEEYVRVSVVALPCVLRVLAFVRGGSADEVFVGRLISNACEFDALGELIHTLFRGSLRLAEPNAHAK
jgi:hypothetical protein